MSDATSSIETTEKPTFSPGPWVASQGCVDGELQGFWNIQVQRGVPKYSYMQDLGMVFDADGHGEANATLLAASPDLLASCKEVREACACAMRVMEAHDDRDALVEAFVAELTRVWIALGFGVRADAAIAKAVSR